MEDADLLSSYDAPAEEDDRLTVDVGSWEGPLDLLLALARTQKVDLREISILALVEQYLDYINTAKSLKLEIAADYLVIAAWLAPISNPACFCRESRTLSRLRKNWHCVCNCGWSG